MMKSDDPYRGRMEWGFISSLLPSNTVRTVYPSSRTRSAEPEKIWEDWGGFQQLLDIELGKTEKGVFGHFDSTMNCSDGEDDEEGEWLQVCSHGAKLQRLPAVEASFPFCEMETQRKSGVAFPQPTSCFAFDFFFLFPKVLDSLLLFYNFC